MISFLKFPKVPASVFLALSLFACGVTPEAAGDECELDGDPCPNAMTCAADGAGDLICQNNPGSPCDPNATDYCLGDAICVSDDAGGGECGIPEGGSCDPKNSFCAGLLVCEEITSGGHACYPPMTLKGKVFEALSTGAIAGAHVIAIDDQGSAATDVAVSDAAGLYELQVPVARNADGTPVSTTFTLRAGAADHQTFPSGLRTALPISTSTAAAAAGGYLIESSLTDIALLLLPTAQRGFASIAGSVLGDDDAGVLVVAEGGVKGLSAVSGADGGYTIFNVPNGDYTVRGYAAGVQLDPRDATVASADLTGIDLAASGAALGTITGNIQIVNAPGGSASSVILVVESTFDDTFVRGEVPRGLRMPLSGPPSVTGDFTIENVPAGTYVVLAAFENDDLVRDPDPNISGTQIVTVTMPTPGTAVELDTSFKVTEALAVVGPGKDEPEAVTGNPTFIWVDDSSEDFYSIVVYNAFGDLVWEDPMVPGVSGGANVESVYAGPALESGMYYQFRATSWRQAGQQAPGPISTTEDLRGVFFVE